MNGRFVSRIASVVVMAHAAFCANGCHCPHAERLKLINEVPLVNAENLTLIELRPVTLNLKIPLPIVEYKIVFVAALIPATGIKSHQLLVISNMRVPAHTHDIWMLQVEKLFVRTFASLLSPVILKC